MFTHNINIKAHRFNTWIRSVCFILSVTFVWQDIVWANPDLGTRSTVSTLQPPSEINTVDLRIEADIRHALALACNNKTDLRISPPPSADGFQTIIDLPPLPQDAVSDRIITGILREVGAGNGIKFAATAHPDGSIYIVRSGTVPVEVPIADQNALLQQAKSAKSPNDQDTQQITKPAEALHIDVDEPAQDFDKEKVIGTSLLVTGAGLSAIGAA